MKYKRKNKDLKARQLIKTTEISQKFIKFLFIYITSREFKILLKNFFYLNGSYKTKIKNFCVISGRSRSIIRKFKVSRIVFRILGSSGIFFGLKKASW
jgi:small subunit ribosomal protein S14